MAEAARAPAMDESELDDQRALMRINRAMARHSYSDRSVTQLAALAVGCGPKGKVDWEKIPPHTMQVLVGDANSAQEAVSKGGVVAMPQTYFLNAQHKVVDHVYGKVTAGSLAQGVKLMGG